MHLFSPRSNSRGLKAQYLVGEYQMNRIPSSSSSSFIVSITVSSLSMGREKSPSRALPLFITALAATAVSPSSPANLTVSPMNSAFFLVMVVLVMVCIPEATQFLMP